MKESEAGIGSEYEDDGSEPRRQILSNLYENSNTASIVKLGAFRKAKREYYSTSINAL